MFQNLTLWFYNLFGKIYKDKKDVWKRKKNKEGFSLLH